MQTTNKYVFFWDGIYSQWYKSPMVIDDIEYNCCEQYMMHQKALLFNDFDIAEAIMQTEKPREQKALGREVKNFNKALWDRKRLGIVVKGNLAKFSQNSALQDELINTEDRIFVEASPVDDVWGIAMTEVEKGVTNPIYWQGTNLLGFALTIVRQELR